MAFRLPQQRDPNDSVRRFVSTALAARQNDQNESFQMQQSLVQMEAQQKRKELLQNAFKTSVDRIKSVYTKPSDEFNREIENEAMQYDMSAPEIATSLRRNKRPEPKTIARKFIDDKGRGVERLEKFDEFSGLSTPIPGTDRVVDENTSTLKGSTTKDNIETEEAILFDAKGNPIKKTKLGEKPVEEKSVYDSAAWRQYQANRDKMHNKALELETVLAGIDASLKAYTDAFGNDKKAVFKYSDGKGTDLATVEEANVLRDRVTEQINAFNKQGADWQAKMDTMESPKSKEKPKEEKTEAPKKVITLDELRAKLKMKK